MKKFIATMIVSVGLLSGTNAYAEKATKESIWRSDYLLMVEQGLHALKAQRYDSAKEKLTEAAKLGNKQAQYYLAQMYLQGWGSEPNYEEGWLWLSVAMEQKTTEWNRSYKQIKEALPAEFITAMQPFVDEHIALYGAKTQDLRCEKRAAIGSHIKMIICEKRYY